ncbi:hypothetical protein HK098_006495 [Nowakowskiella sp. JEL0407]|nr:hypothetical protein HK098_006495 [Nowakowskiella sp. JEL0407]
MVVETVPKLETRQLSDLLEAVNVISSGASSPEQLLTAPTPMYPFPPGFFPFFPSESFMPPKIQTILSPQQGPSSHIPISSTPVTKVRRRCEGVEKVCNMDAVVGRRFCRVCQKRSTNKMREQHVQSLEDQLKASNNRIEELQMQQRALRSFQIMAKRLKFYALEPTMNWSGSEVSDDVLREVHSFLKLFSSYSACDNTTCATPTSLVMQQNRHPTDALVALLNLGGESRKAPLSPPSSSPDIMESPSLP